MPSTAGGNDRYQGEFALVSYTHELSSEEAGAVLIEVEIVNDGEVQLLEIGT